jgi:uncharacterized caspase-like protein
MNLISNNLKINWRSIQIVVLSIGIICITANNVVAARYALVIGNGKYTFDPLKNAVNDARELAKALDGVGFNVTTVKDADKKEMEKAIDELSKKLSKHDESFFFYAGHALQIENENFLLPVDIYGNEEVRIDQESVKLTDIINKVQNANLSIVVLDACRNNPFTNYYVNEEGVLTRSFRGITTRPKKGLAQAKRAIGTLIAYSTAVGDVAYDGDSDNSVFTKYLLRFVKEPGLPLENVFKKVRVAVANETHKRQIPWDSSSITGDFYFVKPQDKVLRKVDARVFTPVF